MLMANARRVVKELESHLQLKQNMILGHIYTLWQLIVATTKSWSVVVAEGTTIAWSVVNLGRELVKRGKGGKEERGKRERGKEEREETAKGGNNKRGKQQKGKKTHVM